MGWMVLMEEMERTVKMELKGLPALQELKEILVN